MDCETLQRLRVLSATQKHNREGTRLAMDYASARLANILP